MAVYIQAMSVAGQQGQQGQHCSDAAQKLVKGMGQRQGNNVEEIAHYLP